MVKLFSDTRYNIDKKKLLSFGEELLQKYDISTDMLLNIAFVGKRKMRAIASTYKHEDIALPVLSFAYNEQGEEHLLGEIIICYPQAVLLAAERERLVNPMLVELIEHGLQNILKDTK